ncbi:MAG: hypothetical protein P4L82_17770 [Ancalomicrobiaceae bacterium]|nr:hypothetical protein [Ancalomicrobiaceae bacterium]
MAFRRRLGHPARLSLPAPVILRLTDASDWPEPNAGRIVKPHRSLTLALIGNAQVRQIAVAQRRREDITSGAIPCRSPHPDREACIRPVSDCGKVGSNVIRTAGDKAAPEQAVAGRNVAGGAFAHVRSALRSTLRSAHGDVRDRRTRIDGDGCRCDGRAAASVKM